MNFNTWEYLKTTKTTLQTKAERTHADSDILEYAKFLTEKHKYGNPIDSDLFPRVTYTPDFEKGFKLAKGLADKGMVDAMGYVGDCYSHGTGVKSSKKMALTYYTLAAIKENPYGSIKLVEMDSVVYNSQEALKSMESDDKVKEVIHCYHQFQKMYRYFASKSAKNYQQLDKREDFARILVALRDSGFVGHAIDIQAQENPNKFKAADYLFFRGSQVYHDKRLAFADELRLRDPNILKQAYSMFIQTLENDNRSGCHAAKDILRFATRATTLPLNQTNYPEGMGPEYVQSYMELSK